ncbi:MAG: BlaI/MecI/CopY family transcriptional regulator [Faecalibacterium sp.]
MQNPLSITLGESEYRFACLIWENEPIGSGALVKEAATQLGWKKSTTYTVLKNLIGKGVLQNDNSVVTALIKKAEIQQAESAALIDRAFEGSLPQFIAAFLGNGQISTEEAAQIRTLLEEYKGDTSC